MIYYALVFLVVALISAVLGLSGIAGTAANLAWTFFIVCLVLAVVFFVRGRDEMPYECSVCRAKRKTREAIRKCDTCNEPM